MGDVATAGRADGGSSLIKPIVSSVMYLERCTTDWSFCFDEAIRRLRGGFSTTVGIKGRTNFKRMHILVEFRRGRGSEAF